MQFAFAGPVYGMERQIHVPKEGSEALNRFLVDSRGVVSAAVSKRTKLEVYLGNEACDVDSMVSSIALAFSSGIPFNSSKAVHGHTAPVLNIPRADLPLRPEATLLLRELLEIDINHLTFIDDIDLDALQKQKCLALTLVDHNTLSPSQLNLSPSVTSIIDHHHDSGRHLDASPRIIESCGSCSTLAAAASDSVLEENQCLAVLLLSGILLDTRNLQERTTESDIQAVEKLCKTARLAHPEETTKLFEVLNTRKLEQGGLETYDLLRKDFKAYNMGGYNVGISSVGLEFNKWSQRSPKETFGFTKERFTRFIVANNLDFYIVMSSFVENGEFQRQLLFVINASDDYNNVHNQELNVGNLVTYLCKDEFELCLEPKREMESEKWMVAFNLRNTAISRKLLVPIIEGFFAA